MDRPKCQGSAYRGPHAADVRADHLNDDSVDYTLYSLCMACLGPFIVHVLTTDDVLPVFRFIELIDGDTEVALVADA